MPPKNVFKQKLILKQKIAARLIEISLQVDDCIYKKKSMSVERAVKYKDEVSLFEPKCKGDERSLQVIEKLKLFMKSIIEGQSITDSEIVAQSPRSALDAPINSPSLLDSTNKTICSTQVQTDEPCVSQESSTVYNDNKNQSLDKSNVTLTKLLASNDAEMDLERTLSNLSLSIIDPIGMEMYSDITNAPTLTDSVNVNKKEKFNNFENKLEVVDLTTSFNDPDLGTTHNMQINATISVSENNNDTEHININSTTTLMTPQNNYKPIDFIEQLSTNSTKITHRKISDADSYINATANETAFNVVTSDHTNKNTVQRKDTKSGKRKRNSKNVRKTRKDSKENGINSQAKLKKVRTKRKNKVTNVENNFIADNLTQNTKGGQGKNRQVTNSDLSWIEKLKFVRIIDPLEIECGYEFPESFWHDDSLPVNCTKYL